MAGNAVNRIDHRQLAFGLLGLTISVGMICRLEWQAAELEAPAEELWKYVREAAVARIDETSRDLRHL